MASNSYVRVFSASNNKPDQLDDQINEEIKQRGCEVTTVSISVGHGMLVALVAFKQEVT